MSGLLSPLNWLLLAMLLGVVAWRIRWRWLAAVSVVLSVVAFAGMTPLVANALVARLERPAAEPAQCQSAPPATVVVLASGTDRPPHDPQDFSALDLASRRRVEHGVQYWRDRGARQVVMAGGSATAGTVPRAELMGEYARQLGLPAAVLTLERRSRDTRGNAVHSAMLEPRLPGRIALVTSALHMPRARLAFEAAGFDVCPQSTDFRELAVAPPGYLWPASSALAKTEAALHEWIGLAYYRWQYWRNRD